MEQTFHYSQTKTPVMHMLAMGRQLDNSAIEIERLMKEEEFILAGVELGKIAQIGKDLEALSKVAQECLWRDNQEHQRQAEEAQKRR